MYNVTAGPRELYDSVFVKNLKTTSLNVLENWLGKRFQALKDIIEFQTFTYLPGTKLL
jgi:hypothetical protein